MPSALGPVRIPARFNGPPASANGGYACGSVAALVGTRVASVRLHAPPPLDTDLPAQRDDDGTVTVRHGETVVATAAPAEPLLGIAPPYVPTLAEAREAMRSHFGFGREHELQHCFVCGAARPSDGLGLTFGPLVARPDMNAAILIADSTLPHHDGTLAPELVWSALDCPSFVPAITATGRLALLAGLTAELLAPVPLGEPVVTVGWPEQIDGRKFFTASALVNRTGTVLARARAVWIGMRAD